MTEHVAARTIALRQAVAWTLSGLTLAMVAAGVALRAVAVDPPFEIWLFVVQALAFGTVGLLIATRRPGNTVGWLFVAVGLVVASYVLAVVYQHHALVVHDGALPFGTAAAWLQAWVYVPALGTFVTFVPQLFPTGRPVSPRWRPALWLAGAALVAFVAVDGLRPGPLSQSTIANPVAMDPSAYAILEPAGLLLYLFATVASIASLIVRWRRADATERQQLKWFLFAASLLPVVVIAFVLVDVLDVDTLDRAWLETTLVTAAYLGLPVATGIAILRHRLFDIDRVVNRTVSYAIVTAVLAGVYAASVVALRAVIAPVTGGSDLAVAGSTLAVAALFGPVRRRVQAAVDRRFDRARYDAGRAVLAFGQHLRDEVDLDEVAVALREAVARTVQPTSISMWLQPRETSP